MGEGADELAAAVCSPDPNTTACGIASFYAYPGLMTNSVKSVEYFSQMAMSGRFQEFIPDFENATSVESALIEPGLDSIDKVPVQFIMAASDTSCPIANARRLALEIKTMAD